MNFTQKHIENNAILCRFLKMNIKNCILLLLFTLLMPTCTILAQTDWLAQHPRLLFTPNEEIQVKELIKQNQDVRKLAYYLKNRADSLATLTQIPYERNRYGNMLYTSRAYVDRLGTLALAYRLYGEKNTWMQPTKHYNGFVTSQTGTRTIIWIQQK